MALLHIERAATGLGGWEVAHTWLRAAADKAISAGGLALALSTAATDKPPASCWDSCLLLN